jgi:geranylgeranyl diphosphate synthase type I
MRDDVLGAFGEEAVTGKPVGGDLREGKPTPLLARAVDAATTAQRDVLDRVGRPGLTDAEVAEIQQVIVDTGALADLESSITALTDEAIAAARAADITAEARDELIALAHYVSWRQV